jgi:hypothetical protein
MADPDNRRRSWIKVGCLGVLALGGILLLWAGGLVGTAYWRGQNEVIEYRELSRPIPAAPGAFLGGRIELEFTVGSFKILRGAPGEPVRIEAEFDDRSYALREYFTESEGSRWTYRVKFDETSWFKDGGLRAVLGGSFPEIKVYLPPDVPLELVGRFGKGAAEVELGGLWLTDVDLQFDKGALGIDIDRPLAAPVERMAIRSKQGGLIARSLGNASPRELEIDHRMGGMIVDLRGQWVRDADVRIASLMGGAEIRLPRDVEIKGLALGRNPAPGREPEVAPPKLEMSVSSWFGALSIVE